MVAVLTLGCVCVCLLFDAYWFGSCDCDCVRFGVFEFWVWVLIGCGLGLVWRGRICCLYGCARCCLLTAVSCSLVNSVDFVILCPFVLYVFMWLGLFLVCGGMLHVYCLIVIVSWWFVW